MTTSLWNIGSWFWVGFEDFRKMLFGIQVPASRKIVCLVYQTTSRFMFILFSTTHCSLQGLLCNLGQTFQLSPPGVSTRHHATAPSSERWNCGWEMSGKFCLNADFHVTFRDPLHAVKLRHGTDGFTSPPKACWGFYRPKNLTASAGCEPANLGTKGQHGICRPPKPLTTVQLLSTQLVRKNKL